MLVRKCAWCNRIYGYKRGGWGVTSGICPACFERETGRPPPRQNRLGDYVVRALAVLLTLYMVWQVFIR